MTDKSCITCYFGCHQWSIISRPTRGKILDQEIPNRKLKIRWKTRPRNCQFCFFCFFRIFESLLCVYDTVITFPLFFVRYFTLPKKYPLFSGPAKYTVYISADGEYSSNECLAYDTQQSDCEVSVMLELWGMQSTLLLPSLPGPLWPGVVAPDGILSMSQIELNCVLMLNWIV